MYTKETLIKDIEKLGLKKDCTVLIHSSYKSIGDVDGRADTVLDAFIEYMKDGLLAFPTHSWNTVNSEHPNFYLNETKVCIGILPELFRQRPNVLRSIHPTHSVSAIGKNAYEFIKDDVDAETPCGINSTWHKMYEYYGYIIFLGAKMTTNTFIHGVEEWVGIPDRLSENKVDFQIHLPGKEVYTKAVHTHRSSFGDVSSVYDKLKEPLIYLNIAKEGKIGDATTVLCDARKMCDFTTDMLKIKPNLFGDKELIPKEWYENLKY